MVDSPLPAESDTGADGGQLRLVRLRLVLTLIAMAILPIAIAAPLVASIIDGQRAQETAQAVSDASAIATSIGKDLDRAQDAIRLFGGDPSLADVLDGTGGSGLKRAQSSLKALATRAGGAVESVSLVDSEGSAKLTVVNGKVITADRTSHPDAILSGTLQLADGSVFRSSILGGSNGDHVISFATPIVPDGTNQPVGILRADLSIDGLIAAAGGSVVSGGGAINVIDSSSRFVLAAATAPTAPKTLGADQAVSAASAIPGVTSWSVQVAEPRTGANRSFSLLAFLGAMILFLAVLVVWMARQILRPAAELDTSRARLRDLYHIARADALRDPLTNLGNHRAFHEELDRQLDQARRYRAPLSLLLLDVDDLKAVNDELGHGAGDDLLSAVGRLIRAAIRTSDRAFRIGGDEFAILFPHTEAEGAQVVGRRLLATSLDAHAVRTIGRSISFSAGVSSSELATDRRSVYAQAEAALAWCKTHGRTAVALYDPTKHGNPELTLAGPDLAASVTATIAVRALYPVYQPIVELRSGRVIGYEGLIRPKPESGFSNAGELFVAAEATGRTTELDRACLDIVAEGSAELPADLLLSVNISPRSLEAPEFSAAWLVDLLRRRGLRPERVILELTEREGVEDVDRIRGTLAACRAAGIRVAADDVGAGNAGLRLLSQVQFDVVKIDLSLVQDGVAHAAAAAVIGSIQELARRWGSWVIAEGIESPEQLELVRRLGIGAGQGYLLGRPGEALAANEIDLDGLVVRGDWLQRLARSAAALPLGASPNA